MTPPPVPDLPTPSYYLTGSGDLYDVCRAHVGYPAMRTHLRLSALEYLYRCEEKGDYRRDLEKAQVLLTRLLAWEAETPGPAGDPSTPTDVACRELWERGLWPPDVPLPDDALAAQCAARGWGVIRPTEGPEARPPVAPPGGPWADGPSPEETTWRTMGDRQGFFQSLAIWDDAPLVDELRQRGYAVVEVPRAPVLVAEEEEDAPVDPSGAFPLTDAGISAGNGQTTETVFAHCLACELAQPPERAWSAAEVLARLGRLGMPAQARWSDHHAEVERRETRWRSIPSEAVPHAQ